jgi:hypothetical protein
LAQQPVTARVDRPIESPIWIIAQTIFLETATTNLGTVPSEREDVLKITRGSVQFAFAEERLRR